MPPPNPGDSKEDTGTMNPIELNGVIYSPMGTIGANRVQRSKVSKYDDKDMVDLPKFRYRPLKSMRRTIRLLRLKGGGQMNPEIFCELFEVEFDDENVVRATSQQARGGITTEATLRSSDASLGPVIEYEALSWCWGTDTKDCGIRIMTGTSQSRLAVTRELMLALKYLRHANKDRALWIDALCIDQANHEERNHQVQMMSRIYSCAQQVCVWLGEDNDDSATAITFIRDIMELENFDAISEKKENAHKWQSLLLLMQRPWFSRRWVVQEIALARAAMIYCGNDKIPWEDFAVAVELFVEVETATHRLSEVMRKDEAFNHVPQWFEHVSELGASVLVQATGKVFRQDGAQIARAIRKNAAPSDRLTERPSNQLSSRQNSGIDQIAGHQPPRPLLSLEYLVSSLSVFEASQPRDAVYSLLTISRDTAPFAELRSNSQIGSGEATIMSTVSSFLERKPFKVDYSRPFTDVCKDFISFCIQGAKRYDPTRSLDIICRPWAPDVAKTSSTVVHKMYGPYKFSPSRKELWESTGRTRQRKRNGAMVTDLRTTDRYWKDVTHALDREWPNHARFVTRAAKFAPRKFVKTIESDHVVRSEAGISVEGNPEKTAEESQEEDIDLPSWVSSVSGASFALFHHPGMHSMKRMGRKNADTLVGLPQDGHRNYSAAQNRKAKFVKFRKRPTLGHYSLYAKGFVLDTVKEVAEPARLGSIPETWTELAGWKDAVDGKEDPPAEFWRTLVADRGKENRNPPYYYATACKESVKKGGLRGGSVDTAALINSERNSIVAEFCRRVQAVIWNRCLIKTGSNILGLASQKVKPGDLVCIIYGCTVPVILRRAPEKTEAQIQDEIIQDGFESLKVVISKCEDACFRRLRYRNKLKELAKVSQAAHDNWKDEVKEEMEIINKQIENWKKKDKEDEQRRKSDDDEKEKRKKDGAARRKKRYERDHLSRATGPTQGRAKTFPASPSSGLAGDALTATDNKELPTSDTQNTQSGRTQEEQVDMASPTESGEQEPSDDPAEEYERRRKKAEAEDPKLYYTLMGEAYIHGFMDGEAVRKQFLEGIPERLFEIR